MFSLYCCRCVCHSLQLAASKAVETLPRNVDFLIHQTYNWFSFSSVRQAASKGIYETTNDSASPLKIQLEPCGCLSPSASRGSWANGTSSDCISSWRKPRSAVTQSRCLFQMYSDPVNKLYLQFLKPILGDFMCIKQALSG